MSSLFADLDADAVKRKLRTPRKPNGAGNLDLAPWAHHYGDFAGRRYAFNSYNQPLHSPILISPDSLGSVLVRFEDRTGVIRHKSFPRSAALDMIGALLDGGAGFCPRGIIALCLGMLSGT